MDLGAAGLGREAGPAGTQPAQLHARRIDQVDGLANGAAQVALRLADHGAEQLAEHRRGPPGVGVGQGGTRHRLGPHVIEPHRVALQAAHHLPQAGRPRQLSVQQRNELVLGRKAANVLVRPVLGNQSIKLAPRNLLQQVVENAILVPHGVDPFSYLVNVANVQTRVESTPCTLSTKIKPDTRAEACDLIRSLIEAIVLVPVDGALEAALAGILEHCADGKKALAVFAGGPFLQLDLVAGARNHLYLLVSTISPNVPMGTSAGRDQAGLTRRV